MHVAIQDRVQEFEPVAGTAPAARLLLARCLTADPAPVADDGRARRGAAGQLLRGLQQRFAARDSVLPTGSMDVLLAVTSRSMQAAVGTVQDAIRELRGRASGAGAMGTTFTVESLTVHPQGGMTAVELMRDEPPMPAAPHLRLADAAADGEPPMPGMRFSFSPVWDQRDRAPMTYYLRCHPPARGTPAPGTPERSGHAALPGAEDSPLVSALDFAVLARATTEAMPYRNRGLPFVLVWQVHARTVEAADGFSRYGEMLARISEFAGNRIAVELVGVAPDWPLARMQATIGLLARYAPVVAVRQPLDTAAFAALAACGATNVAVALDDAVEQRGLAPVLERFRDGAERAGLVTVAEEITRGFPLAAATAAGFRYIHLDGLAPRRARSNVRQLRATGRIPAAPATSPAAATG